jgi:hypothetical protein
VQSANERLLANGWYGSVAVVEYIPKAAARAAPTEGIPDLAT